MKNKRFLKDPSVLPLLHKTYHKLEFDVTRNEAGVVKRMDDMPCYGIVKILNSVKIDQLHPG